MNNFGKAGSQKRSGMAGIEPRTALTTGPQPIPVSDIKQEFLLVTKKHSIKPDFFTDDPFTLKSGRFLTQK